MSIRRTAALTAAAAIAMTGLAAAPQAQAAYGTDACYTITVADYGDIRPIIAYPTQIELDARGAGISLRWSNSHESALACAPSSYTVYKTYARNMAVGSFKYSSMHSTADGTFRVSLPSTGDAVVIPERSPYYLASKLARENGLEVDSSDPTRTSIVVKGNPATVQEIFAGRYIRQIG